MIRKRISVAFFLWIVSFLVLFLVTDGLVHPSIFIGLLIPVFMFLNLNEKVSFLLYITFTIVSSLVILSLAFMFDWTTWTQLMWIVLHALLLINLWSIYVIAKWTSALSVNNRRLNNRVKELEEYIVDTKILSKREFDKQKEIILTSMVRKRETGYLVYVGLEELPVHVKKTSFVKFSDIIYESLRKHFDIVGKYGEEMIIFLLQNTQEEGLDVVNRRIQSQLERIYTKEALSAVQWSVEEVGHRELHQAGGDPRL